MRFHSVASVAVLIFSSFFNLSVEKYCILFLTMGFVIVSELFNTAIENVIDIKSENYSIVAKVAKDITAGAVFVAACFAVLVAICLFNDIHCYVNMILFFWANPYRLMLLALFGVFGYFYTVLGPAEVKNKAKKMIKILKNKK